MVSNSNAPSGTKEGTAEMKAFLDRAAKQMDKWENAAKDRGKEHAEKEKEITQVLEKLNEATRKNEESSL
eukprot:4545288-Ditylum_brightwellii.AAC.1